MKKKNTILPALILSVIMLSGCSGGNTTSSDSTTSSEQPTEAQESTAAETTAGATKTEMAFSAETEEDTTPQSIEFIRGQSPLFAKFLEIRTSFPLSMVTQYEAEGQTYELGFILKDEHCMAEYMKLPDGSVTKAIYDVDTGYQINDTDKTVYKVEAGAFMVDYQISTRTFTVPIDSVSQMTFSEDTAEYEGQEYKRVSLSEGGEVQSEYYFDKDTDSLRYIVGGGSAAKVTVFENSVYDEGLFTIPDDYRIISDTDELNDILGIETYVVEDEPESSQ